MALPQGIEQIIRQSVIPKRDVSIYIKEAGDGGRVIASYQANKTRTPASVIKVLTTYAAALKLGFNYKFPTKFYTNGYVRSGVLNGDLVIKGFGDPTLDSEDLINIVSEIRAEGIRKINGNIVIDRSYFKVGTKNSSGFDQHPYSPYNAMPDAMMFNERVSTICVTPNKNTVTKKTPDKSYNVINKLKRVNRACRGRYSWPAVKISKSKNVSTIVLKGKISKRCGERKVRKVLTKPYKSFYYALKDELQQSGILVTGWLSLRKVPKSAKVLFTHFSEPLEKIISKTSKKSNNLYARHLLLYLGAKMYGAPATLSKGRRAVESILRYKGALRRGTLKIDNGSGLSRTAKMSAKMLAEMYDNAYMSYGKRWMKTLSIGGVDGTIKKRFRGTSVENRAWMKTGTLRRTKNIGGYVKSKSGKMYTVVILVKTKKAKWKAAELQNDILKWLVDGRVSIKKVKRTSAKSSKRVKKKRIATPVRKAKKKRVRAPVIKVTKPKASAVNRKNKQKNSTTYANVRYYVQVGSFKLPPSKKYLMRLKRLGLNYRVEYTSTYKVLVGSYSLKNDAKRALKKLRKHVNSGAFITKL
jgi:D-alanyl-D-alanine carboxypeptidase/D-alanyl-D-alanine-endopeptidase (penicillin-binding protein 4)